MNANTNYIQFYFGGSKTFRKHLSIKLKKIIVPS